MRIAIIGAGRVGAGLGRAWLRAGHQVVFGVREPADPEYADLRADGADMRSVAAALDGADVVMGAHGMAEGAPPSVLGTKVKKFRPGGLLIVRAGGRCHKNRQGFDLVGLFVGSEGMLGVVTEITLRIIPHPPARALLGVTFRTFAEAAAAVLSASMRCT